MMLLVDMSLKLSVRIYEKQQKKIMRMVEKKKYKDKSDVIRAAIDQMAEKVKK